jgi:hypothetical protein
MTEREGHRIVEAANYLIGIYRNVAAMLLSCDPMVAEYGLIPYGNRWKPMAPIKPELAEPEWWLPHRAVRQYHREGREDEEVFSIGALLCEPENAAFPEPLAIASMMRVTSTNSDAIYWLPLLGHGDYPAGLGKVRKLDVRKRRNDDDWFNSALDLVADGQLLTIAVPLLDITNTSDVEDRLVKPLVDAMKSAGA